MNSFKAGQQVNQGTYRAFIPELVNRPWQLDDMELIGLLSKADRQLGRLDMYSGYVPIDLYLSLHIAKEATQSSRIEGTQTHIEEAFLGEEDIQPQHRDDWRELQNYIRAMNEAIAQLNELPFSTRLILQAHGILLSGVRGTHKLPGDFRRSQNWIGGATLSDAVFIPPPPTHIAELMSDLERFVHDENNPLPDLLKVAIMHYQFETIHPFLDGNGRVGRLMITLYLVSKGILKQPILYLSDFFERHRSLYYDNLMRVRTHNDIAQWLKFFLVGITETAKSGIQTFDAILRLQSAMDDRLKHLGGRIGDAREVIQRLYVNPLTDASQVASTIGKSNVSAYKLIADLEKAGILHEITGARRGRMYAFREYLDLFVSDSSTPS